MLLKPFASVLAPSAVAPAAVALADAPTAVELSELAVETVPSAVLALPDAFEIRPNAAAPSAVASDPAPKAELKFPVAFALPPTAVESVPVAVAWQFAGSVIVNPPPAVAPDWHSAIATPLLATSAISALPLISAARRPPTDNTSPFAPACAALLRYDFMFNPVQRGTDDAQPIFFWREIRVAAPRPPQTPVTDTPRTKGPGRLVRTCSGITKASSFPEGEDVARRQH